MALLITLPGFLVLFFYFDASWGVSLLIGFLAGQFILSTLNGLGICGGIVAKAIDWAKKESKKN